MKDLYQNSLVSLHLNIWDFLNVKSNNEENIFLWIYSVVGVLGTTSMAVRKLKCSFLYLKNSSSYKIPPEISSHLKPGGDFVAPKYLNPPITNVAMATTKVSKVDRFLILGHTNPNFWHGLRKKRC